MFWVPRLYANGPLIFDGTAAAGLPANVREVPDGDPCALLTAGLTGIQGSFKAIGIKPECCDVQ